MVVARIPDEYADIELAHGTVLDGDAIVTDRDDPAITDLVQGAGRKRGSVAVDGVAVQVERDAVSTNHDAVVSTVDQVAVEPRIHGDLVAAADVTRQRPVSGRGKDDRDRQGNRPRDENRRL